MQVLDTCVRRPPNDPQRRVCEICRKSRNMFETPIKSGLLERCGRCGKGRLFRRYLKFHDKCAECEMDFTIADTADGPAFFVGSLVMIVFAPFYFILPVIAAPLILKLILWVLLLSVMGACIYFLLPKFKVWNDSINFPITKTFF